MNPKKTLRIAGIVCLVACLVSVVELVLDFTFYEFNLYYTLMDVLGLGLSLVTGITYLCLQRKEATFLTAHKGIFVTFLVINIFNNFIVWAVTLWVEIVVTRWQRVSMAANGLGQDCTAAASDTTNNIVLDRSEYTATDVTQTLSQEIAILEKMHADGVINDKEYFKMKHKLLDNMPN